MDSSRSGLLSTLLMTLPLIVVPAVALLRPPGQAGISSAPLDAAEDDEFDSMFDDFDGFDSDPSGAIKKEEGGAGTDRLDSRDARQPSSVEDEIFNDMDLTSTDRRGLSAPRTAPSRTAQSDPFMDASLGNAETPAKRGNPEPSTEFDAENKPDARQIVEQLNSMGALKSLWFAAGDKKPVGLAVFFRGDTEKTRIRFEAVGLSRDECAENVLQQVTFWQQQNSQ